MDVVQTGGAKAKDRSFALVLLVMVEALRPRQVPLVTATARGGAQSVAPVPTSVGIATLGPLVLVALTLRGQWLGIVLPLQNHILTERRVLLRLSRQSDVPIEAVGSGQDTSEGLLVLLRGHPTRQWP